MKDDIADFQEHYAGKYHHYITIGYIIKNPEIEMPEEQRHFYLSEVPSYEHLTEDNQNAVSDTGKYTNIDNSVVEETGFPTKTPILSGESLHQDHKV